MGIDPIFRAGALIFQERRGMVNLQELAGFSAIK
jgi:hypothetical protein